MLNILIDSLNCNPHMGSNAESGYGFTCQAVKRNRVFLLSHRELFSDGGNPLSESGANALSLHLLEPGMFAKLGRQSDYLLRSYFLARKVLRNNRIDIIHTIEPNQYRLVRPLSFIKGVPFILGPLNGGDAYPPAEFLADLKDRDFSKRSCGGRNRGLLRLAADAVNNQIVHGAVAGAATLLAFRTAKRIIIGTDNCLNNIPRAFHAKCLKIPCFGVDTELFSPADHSENPDPVILYAGRISPWKGLDLLIKAFAGVAHRCQVVLRVAGTGGGDAADEKFETYCRQLVCELKLEERVFFLGQIARTALVEEYRHCDMFCMTSLWEPFGMVYIEAMACGKPVIAMSSGGPAEIIKPDFGFAVKPERLNSFLAEVGERIAELSLSREKRQSMGMAARRHVLENYTWDTIGLKMQKVYEEAV
jgi:glycosyltransferase involved in cell wall biosynthesis